MTSLEHSIAKYFGVIAPEQLKAITSFFKTENYSKGSFFLRSGKDCDRLSFVHDGLLRIYVETAEKEVTQWISTPGYFVN